jgi:periplasmic divalent cation tolerance protein
VVALMTDSPRLVLALTTEADQARAQTLAEALLERRLVACVSLQPLLSLYRWKGELQRDAEVQLLLKTSADQLGRLQEAVMELHSYDTPELLTWPVEASGTYGAWALAQLSSDGLRPAPAGTPGDEPPAG